MNRRGTDFSGLSVAIVTPFQDGKLDKTALRQQIEFQIQAGTDCIVPVGTTGESPTLSHPEHEEVISEVIQLTAGRAKVMAGTGSNCTSEAISLTKWAAKEGADATLQVAPYYNKPTQEGFYQHFKAIAESLIRQFVDHLGLLIGIRENHFTGVAIHAERSFRPVEFQLRREVLAQIARVGKHEHPGAAVRVAAIHRGVVDRPALAVRSLVDRMFLPPADRLTEVDAAYVGLRRGQGLTVGEDVQTHDVTLVMDPGHENPGWMAHEDEAEEAHAEYLAQKKVKRQPNDTGRDE